MARREDEVEEEEIQGGEINLVPYLDIVTNLMLFLLASISSGFILGQIDTTLPDHSTASTKPAVDPDQKPDEQPLQLMVRSLSRSSTCPHPGAFRASGRSLPRSGSRMACCCS